MIKLLEVDYPFDEEYEKWANHWEKCQKCYNGAASRMIPHPDCTTGIMLEKLARFGPDFKGPFWPR